MSDNRDAESLQREMARVRDVLVDEVEGIVTNARELSDWRYYVRRHPWACVGAAAAVGFLAVPRRLQVVTPDAESLAKLAKQNRLVVTPRVEPQKSGGLTASLLTLGANMLFRSAIAFVGQQMAKHMADAQQEPRASTASAPPGADHPPNH